MSKWCNSFADMPPRVLVLRVQHALMYSAFAVSGVVDLIGYYTPLPQGSEQVGGWEMGVLWGGLNIHVGLCGLIVVDRL